MGLVTLSMSFKSIWIPWEWDENKLVSCIYNREQTDVIVEQTFFRNRSDE